MAYFSNGDFITRSNDVETVCRRVNPDAWSVRVATHQVHVRRPVEIVAGSGNPFTMYVAPANLGGTFSWNPSGCSCTLSGSGSVFSWSCPSDCTCCGCSVGGSYSYDGYALPAASGVCRCHYDEDDPQPRWEETTGPLAASVSAAFTTSVVIFEDAYENRPGQWAGKNSTRTRLNVVAVGGPNGGTLSVSSANLAKLSRLSGPELPLSSVSVPAETQVSYAIVYEGAVASGSADDIMVSASFVENTTYNTMCVTSKLTAVEVAMTAHFAAPSNSCLHRHEFGVNEWVHVAKTPACATIAVSIDDDSTLVGADNDQFWCPWSGGSCEVAFASGNVTLTSNIGVYEPEPRAIHAEWDGQIGTGGCSGQVGMNLIVALYPMTVSFCGIYLQEIPDEEEDCPRYGYFANADIGRPWSHTAGAGAGVWTCVNSGNIWTGDHVGTSRSYPAPWSEGWKEWSIPVGWGTYESGACRLKGSCRACPTTQRFEIDFQGTVTIRKFLHSIRRSTDNKVWLDGVRVN